jgi:hypothetical protein
MAASGYTMFMKNAWRLLTSPLSVPKAPLIAFRAGAIVLEIAVPMLSIAAMMALKSIPNCALAGRGAIKDIISTTTRTMVRYSHSAFSKLHFGSMPLPFT